MTPEQIAADIARGLEIRIQLEQLKDELKRIDARLEAAGLASPQTDLKEAEREGKQAVLVTPNYRLPVRFESDVLIGGFEIESDTSKEIAKLLTPAQFNLLFKKVAKYERKESDGHKFRLKAKAEIKDQPKYLSLIKLLRSLDKHGIPKNKTVIAWDDAEILTPATQQCQSPSQH